MVGDRHSKAGVTMTDEIPQQRKVKDALTCGECFRTVQLTKRDGMPRLECGCDAVALVDAPTLPGDWV